MTSHGPPLRASCFTLVSSPSAAGGSLGLDGVVAAHQLVQLAGGEGGDDLLALLVGERAAVGAVEAELGDVVAHQLVQLGAGRGVTIY